jgi:predicted transcriptional regulator
VSASSDILISLAPAYTKAILEGRKTVELRHRRIRIVSGTRVWLYSKVPIAKIEGIARVQLIREAAPMGLWSEYSDAAGISRVEFDEYFRGCTIGCAIVLARVHRIEPTLDLVTMRSKVKGFHPPQFIKKLRDNEVKILLHASRPASMKKPKVNLKTPDRKFASRSPQKSPQWQ